MKNLFMHLTKKTLDNKTIIVRCSVNVNAMVKDYTVKNDIDNTFNFINYMTSKQLFEQHDKLQQKIGNNNMNFHFKKEYDYLYDQI